jgi:uncharacterized protein (DUF983 family)
MCAKNNEEKPGAILSVLQNRCPRCRRGKLYKQDKAYKKGFMKMNDRCPVCRQPFDMEPGFYYGTGFVSYGLAITISVATLVAWWILIGISVHDNRFFWWMGINALFLVLLQPPLMRISRTIWIYFFVPYSRNWDKGDIMEPERVNKEQQNNW